MRVYQLINLHILAGTTNYIYSYICPYLDTQTSVNYSWRHRLCIKCDAFQCFRSEILDFAFFAISQVLRKFSVLSIRSLSLSLIINPVLSKFYIRTLLRYIFDLYSAVSARIVFVLGFRSHLLIDNWSKTQKMLKLTVLCYSFYV
jgi:hypothetical protein